MSRQFFGTDGIRGRVGEHPLTAEFALRLASGDALHTPSDAEQSITDKLTMAARIDEDMQRVLAEWYAALERAGSQLRPQPKPRKRSHMVANA